MTGDEPIKQSQSGRGRLLIVDNDETYFPTHRITVAEGALDAGFEVHVALPLTDPKVIRDQYPQFQFHHVPFDRTGTNIYQDLRTCFALRSLYRRLKPSLVHHFSLKPVLYGGWAARLAGVPGVISAMTGLGILFGENNPRIRLLRRLVVAGLRWGCNQDNVRMIYQNTEDRDVFRTLHIGMTKHDRVIPGSGVCVDQYPASTEQPGSPLVVFASRMLWTKGVGEFVSAAKLLRDAGSQARFILAGDTDSNPSAVPRAQLEAWQHEGKVEWWGHCDDMPSVFAQSHVVCLPTVYREGVPKVLIEAASSARPIVTTDIPGCRDIVRNGYNGILIAPHDAGELAGAINRLLGNPDLRKKMGQNGRKLVIERFSTKQVMRETINVYDGLANAR
jgi:glycosyltransferase involved in cell wall biosynthesis